MFLRKAFTHFRTIKDDPLKFVLWVLLSIILALCSVWVPAILGIIVGKNLFMEQMKNNPFIVFSIVFLSNTILSAINQLEVGTNKFAITLRGITLVVTIMYLVFLAALIPFKLMNNITLGLGTQFILLSITILLGVYTYGFREGEWEKSVGEFTQDAEREISNIQTKANSITQEGKTKL